MNSLEIANKLNEDYLLFIKSIKTIYSFIDQCTILDNFLLSNGLDCYNTHLIPTKYTTKYTTTITTSSSHLCGPTAYTLNKTGEQINEGNSILDSYLFSINRRINIRPEAEFLHDNNVTNITQYMKSIIIDHRENKLDRPFGIQRDIVYTPYPAGTGTWTTSNSVFNATIVTLKD